MTIEEKGKPVSDADRQMLNARVEQAGELFGSGYNCSQSVVAAFADLYGVERELALRMSAPFGGGIGRMRETCGAACGLFMLTGLENGSTEAGDRKGKGNNYKLVQELAAEFRRRNGSCVCRELLGLACRKEEPVPAERTAEYYKKRPCVELVACAARIVGEYLQRQNAAPEE